MAASAASLAYVQKMFLAYFGRPVAPTGQDYYAGLIDAGNVAALQDDFWNSTESQSKFSSLTTEGKVTAIFQQLFGRDPAISGLTYWTAQISSGAVTLPAAALTILNSAAGDDLTIFNAKLSVADAFTAQLDTAAEVTGLQNNTAAAAEVLANIKTTAAATAAITDIVNIVKTVVEGNGGATPGQTFTLTNSTDNFTGTSGNDTFIGDNLSTSAGDTIVGGAGTDTLKLFGNTSKPAFSNIETLYLNANTAGFDISTNSGVTTLQLDDVATAQTYTIANTVTNASVANMTANEVLDFAGNTVTGLTVEVSGNGTGTGLNAVANDVQLDFNSTAQTEVTFNATTKASYIELLNTGAALKTVNIKGDKAFGLNTQLTTVTTINAADNTAGVNVVVEGASALTFTGGAGNDRIHTTTTLTTTDSVVGGNGTDTFAVSEGDNVDTAAEVNTVSGFEIFEAVHDTDTVESYDVSLFAAKNTFSGIKITGDQTTSQRVITVSKIGDAAKENITVSLGSNDADGVTLTATSHVSGGVSDTAKVILSNVNSAGTQVSATGIDLGTVTFANVDVLSVVSTSDGTPTKTLAGGEAQKITSLVATDMDKLIVTGDEAIDITLDSTSASVSEIDASGMTSTAAVDIDTAAAAVASVLVKGGAGADAITINNAATLAATVYTNGGNDAVTLVGGGTGVYTLKFTGTSLGGGDIKAGTAATVTLSAAAAGDKVNIDFGTEIENLLKVAGVNLGTTVTTPDLEAATLGSTTNVAINAAGAVYTMQIDLDGDGTYVAANDFQVAITLTGLTASDGTAVYNSTTDMFVITAA